MSDDKTQAELLKDAEEHLEHAEVHEEEIVVDDGASFAAIAAAHSAAVVSDKTVQVDDIDGVVGGLAEDTAAEAPAAEAPAAEAPAAEAPAAEDTAAEAPAAPVAEAAAAPAVVEGEVASKRKVREGTVVSNKMDKTAVIVATDRVRHRRYNKTVQRDKRLYVHDEDNTMNIGDVVRIVETRPLSKNKRWRLLEVVERAR